MPIIFEIRSLLNRINATKQNIYIKLPEIFIFGAYLVCWAFVLITSYRHYPVEFNLMKYFLTNIMAYLCIPNDSFSIV